MRKRERNYDQKEQILLHRSTCCLHRVKRIVKSLYLTLSQFFSSLRERERGKRRPEKKEREDKRMEERERGWADLAGVNAKGFKGSNEEVKLTLDFGAATHKKHHIQTMHLHW